MSDMITIPRGKYFKLFITLSLLLLIAGIIFLYRNMTQENITQKNQDDNRLQEKNYYEIDDGTAGVSFRISKRFSRMSTGDMQAKTPFAIYGFSVPKELNVFCLITQTPREQGGPILVSELRDGIFNQMKKKYPDANLDDAKAVEIGENNNKGAKLKMSFTEINKTPMFQWEVVGITDKSATFAFCTCPKSVIDLYRADFDLFLDGVRIK